MQELEVKVKLWAGAELPDLKLSSFDIKIHSFRKLFKGKKEMDTHSILQSSISQGYIHLRPFERISIGTGLEFNIPNGVRLEIVSNPGFVLNKGVLVLSPTYVDSNFKKEVQLILHNSSQFLAKICIGDIVAKGSFVPYLQPNVVIDTKEAV